MMNFQGMFGAGMQDSKTLSRQVAAMTQAFAQFLRNAMPEAPEGTLEAVSAPAETLQPLIAELMTAHQKLWEQMAQQKPGATADPVVPEAARDRRFASAAWSSSPMYDYLRQAYVLNSRFLLGLAEKLPADNSKEAARLRFLTEQFVDAMSPSNFAATNPEVVQKAIATEGKSLTAGISNLLGQKA